jgi:hypothetical protein
MISRFPFASAALLLLAGFNVQADIIQLHFETLPTNTNDGTYNGFVGVSGNGVTSLSLICDDFLDTTYVPSGPTPFSLSTLANLSDTRFGSLSRYEEAALLLYGDGQSNLPGLMNDPANTSAYQYALWNLMEPGAVASKGYSDPGAAALLAIVENLNLANTNYQSLYGNLRIYTPMASGTDQEFLGFTPGTTSPTVPEPRTWLMLLGALTVTALVIRKRFIGSRQRKAYVLQTCQTNEEQKSELK